MRPVLSLETTSALVRHLGTRTFPELLWAWLASQVPLSHLCAARFRQAAPDRPLEACDSLFFQGIYDAEQVELSLQHYLRKYWVQDPVLPYVQRLADMQLVQWRSANQASPDYCRDVLGRGELREACVMLGRGEDGVYSVELFRNQAQPPFRLDELTLLRQLSELVLPLTIQHARLTVPLARSQSPSLPELFDRRVASSGIRLSSRERDTCHCALLGQTAQHIASTLGVRDSTVKTYLERAFAKLALRSRAELFSWCLACA